MRALRPPLRRRPTNVTLSRKLLAMSAAFAHFKNSEGEMAPTRTWMIEQGLLLFFEKMASKFPDFRTILKDIDLQFRKMEELNKRSIGRGAIRSIAGRSKRQ